MRRLLLRLITARGDELRRVGRRCVEQRGRGLSVSLGTGGRESGGGAISADLRHAGVTPLGRFTLVPMVPGVAVITMVALLLAALVSGRPDVGRALALRMATKPTRW